VKGEGAVIQSAIYIQGLELTPEEKEAHRLKFEAWYDSFLEKHGEDLKRIREERGE
jgi:hypothetical protein